MANFDKKARQRRHTLLISTIVVVAFSLISSARALYRALNPRNTTNIHFVVSAELRDLQPLCDQIPLDACVHYDPPPTNTELPFPHLYIAQHALAPRLLMRDGDCDWRLSYRTPHADDSAPDSFVTVARSARGVVLLRRERATEAQHD